MHIRLPLPTVGRLMLNEQGVRGKVSVLTKPRVPFFLSVDTNVSDIET
jgi:hypothetical protein